MEERLDNKAERLDKKIVDLGFATGRDIAKEYISRGQVLVNSKPVTKASVKVIDTDKVEFVGEGLKYVGKGGLKLERALEYFKIDCCGRVCMDIGASTGGFTDCMLRQGAAFVYAVDVGTDQLAPKLRSDKRVKSLENTDVRDLKAEDFPEEIDFLTADVSFISLKNIAEPVFDLLKPGGEAVLLLKPQFEVGKRYIGKKGIVTDKKAHETLLSDINAYFYSLSLSLLDLTYSPIRGGKGNVEYLLYLKNSPPEKFRDFDYRSLVNAAFIKTKEAGSVL